MQVEMALQKIKSMIYHVQTVDGGCTAQKEDHRANIA